MKQSSGKEKRVHLLVKTIVLAIVVFFMLSREAMAGEPFYSNDQIADAIYLAEGGAKTNHPYGILAKYKTTTPRQACINTIKSARIRFAKQSKETDFVYFLSLTYCPIGAKNDPTGLNKNWIKNVKFFLERG